MKEFAREVSGAFFDLRSIVALCGIVLSVAAHELFHIIIHLHEIDSISFFPDSSAIVEIIFTPSTQYNLAIEETIAYFITMITLILTAMLIGDISDLRAEKLPRHTILTKEFSGCYQAGDEYRALGHLQGLLGIKSQY